MADDVRDGLVSPADVHALTDARPITAAHMLAVIRARLFGRVMSDHRLVRLGVALEVGRHQQP